jgi:hypothetical protein
MMPANLTAADLDAIEARLAVIDAAYADAKRVDTKTAWHIYIDALSEFRDDFDGIETALLSALRAAWAERDEARGLVEALVAVEPVCYRPYPDGWECLACNVTVAKRRNLQHAPDCAWDAARKAREAWGGGDAD